MKDPYELVCHAFVNNDLKKLLLGERGYGYKQQPRQDFTNPEETTDIGVIYTALIKYYLENHKNTAITQKIFDALLTITDTPLGIDTVSSIVAMESSWRDTKDHPYRANLDLDLNRLATHLRTVIRKNKDTLMQIKLFGGKNFPGGFYEILNRRSNRTYNHGGPRFI